MTRIKTNQSGFAFFAIIGIIVVLSAVGGAAYLVLNKQQKNNEKPISQSNEVEQSNTQNSTRIKHIGAELDNYGEKTNKAGDFAFTQEKLSFDRLFFDFGFIVPANSAGPEKKNPQPTYIVPLGTKVHALVDGEIYDVPKLYSNDYSVIIKPQGIDLIFELEHVINVQVKKGDVVKAGDIIAEVSDYDAKNYAGLGLVEIGILKGSSSGPPLHLCPFEYLDDSIKESTLQKITALQKSWEQYRGDDTIYDESNATIPGCITTDPIEG